MGLCSRVGVTYRNGLRGARFFNGDHVLDSIQFNREALLLSAILLGIGVASGVILGAQPGKELSPTDPAILSSSMMFLWIVGACIFEVVYQPARQGKKVAYVTLANFVFLVLVLTLVLYSGHAGE